jgi:subtilisin family serine protease
MNVVVASGNGGGPVDYPGRFDEAFTAAGVQDAHSLCPFSARGPEVDILAPGCDLAQSGWDGQPLTVSGTSFAAPIAAGALAVLRSYVPSLSWAQAEELLRAPTVAMPGVLNVAATLSAAGVSLPSGRGSSAESTPSSQAVAEQPSAASTRIAPPLLKVTRRGGWTYIRRVGDGQFRTIELACGSRTARRRLGSRGTVRFQCRRAIRVRYVGPNGTSKWTRVS